jgi:hypothetical protein
LLKNNYFQYSRNDVTEDHSVNAKTSRARQHRKRRIKWANMCQMVTIDGTEAVYK